ncbi:prolyl oligopeptidase family serine peptidase [Luteococcus sp. OSA5]|uniref:S9 family peptidase n=1 Tax=Luteococcus sp. OSA5 TaxID=3401630 RepID=UPI003B42EDCC
MSPDARQTPEQSTEPEQTTEPELGSPWEDLRSYIELPRLSGVQVSPDGRWLLATIQTLNHDRTAWTSALWRIDPSGEARPHRLTRGVEGESLSAILRDGSVLFTSSRPLPADGRAEDDDKALWCLPALGGEAQVVARRAGGFTQVLAAREADALVCAVGVASGCDDLQQDRELRSRRRKAKVNAILHESPGVRFWDHDLPRESLRLVTLPVSPEQDSPVQDSPVQETMMLASPELGRGLDADGVLSSHGDFVVATLEDPRPRGRRHCRLVRITLRGQDTQAEDESQVVTVVADDHSQFEHPVLSRDDRWVACVRYVAGTPTEAPHQFLHLVDLHTGEHHDLAPEWPRWAKPVAFSADGQELYVVADEDGDCPVFAISVGDGQVRRLTQAGAHSSVVVAPDGEALYAVRSSWTEPGSIVRICPRTATSTVLHQPAGQVQLPGRLERIQTSATDGQTIHSYLLLPETATPQDPAPLVLWAHGGPLNSWNAWSWRWCPWLLVSQGQAVLLPDPALSTGYGRDFIQRGWGRWGAEPYTDLMAVTDAVEQRPDIDADRTAMMGGSFGGYMANWIAGHTDRFRCIVSHASLWNLNSFGPTTDAPWYWAQEMSAEMMEQNSPHQFVDRITTPMLVIHGDKDYRVPIGEGLALWWALSQAHEGDPEQMEHKFLYFPDENHWVLTPQHAMVWYETVRGFLSTHLEGQPFLASSLLSAEG